jgi:hypothetical protein
LMVTRAVSLLGLSRREWWWKDVFKKWLAMTASFGPTRTA